MKKIILMSAVLLMSVSSFAKDSSVDAASNMNCVLKVVDIAESVGKTEGNSRKFDVDTVISSYKVKNEATQSMDTIYSYVMSAGAAELTVELTYDKDTHTCSFLKSSLARD